MKQALCSAALVLLAAISITGCDRRPTRPALDSGTDAGPQFTAKRGLLLPEQTRRAIGLKLVEVTERRLTSRVEMELRVYRTNQTTVQGAALVQPEQAKLLKTGQDLEVTFPNGTRTGRVIGVHAQFQQSTGLNEVLAEVTGPELPPVAAGTFLKARAIVESNADVLTIPCPALLTCSEGQFVYTVSGEHLVRTPVKVGARGGEFIAVTDGLYPGDQVVVAPVLVLWLTELAAVKGGQACCIEPPKGK